MANRSRQSRLTVEILSALRASLGAIRPGATLLVAVSGGPDSLCLLHALCALRSERALKLHVFHLDHQLRGEQSAAEAEFVAATARAWELPITLLAHDAHAAAQGGNLSAGARELRYRLLAETALAIGATAVLTAHQADDQAETVLINLLRGAGPDGLAGMQTHTPWEAWRRTAWGFADAAGPPLVRPFLGIRRTQIDAYCREHGLEPRHDPSNTDPAYARSRIRHELLPYLATYNPQISAALTRTAAVCAADAEYIRLQLEAAWPTLVQARPGGFAFDGARWQALHPALQRAALRHAHALLADGRPIGLEQIDHARAVALSGVGKRAELPGKITLTVGYNGDFTLGADILPDAPQFDADLLELPERGELLLGAWRLRIVPEYLPADGRWHVCLDRTAIGESLLLRRRRPGDRIRLAGKPGSKRIQDLLVDAHIPRAARAAWPIITTPTRIVWLVGVGADATLLATEQTRHPLYLCVESRGDASHAH
jgi:tRNA(Ile)-lysidine synthetase-like protein